MRSIRFIAVLLSVLIVSVIPAQVLAGSASGFQAGRIIDDEILTNSTSMSKDDIQAFLNNKVPVCDTWGDQVSEYGGGTRLEWAVARGYSTPFTCLKDYTENGKTAAQILYDTAQQYHINPQVLLVLLQREQGLVTDSWPLTSQYKLATGYGCADMLSCASTTYGLTNQLQLSGHMLHSIMVADPNWYSAYSVGSNYIQYSPNMACGGSTVNIQNRATVALYSYVPYQPNQAALNVEGFGVGDTCSSYGNRNFYLYFTNWFGATLVTSRPEVALTVNGNKDATAAYGSNVTLKWVSKNTDGCTISTLGAQPSSGELSLSRVAKSARYTIDCTGVEGSVQDSVNLTVLPPTFAYLQDTLSNIASASSKATVLQGQVKQADLASRSYTQGDVSKAKKILADVSDSVGRLLKDGKISSSDAAYLQLVIHDLIDSL